MLLNMHKSAFANSLQSFSSNFKLRNTKNSYVYLNVKLGKFLSIQGFELFFSCNLFIYI